MYLLPAVWYNTCFLTKPTFFLFSIVLIYIKQMLKHYFAYHTLSKVAFLYFLFRLEILLNNNLCFKHSIKKDGGLTHAGKLRD